MPEILYTFRKKHEEAFLEELASGEIEDDLIEKYKVPMGIYIMYLAKDPEFKERVEEAKKRRADKWFGEIIESTKSTLTKDDVPGEKLKFEQRKYLAAIDNPDKYGERVKHQHDVTVNIFNEMKNLSHAEARKIMVNADPFALPKPEIPSIPDAQYTEISDDVKYDTSTPMTAEDDEIDNSEEEFWK